MKMSKPQNADWYDWETFIRFFNKTYPNIKFDIEDEKQYWEFWKAGYIRAMNS